MKYSNYSKSELIKKIRTMEKSEEAELNKRNELIRSQYFSTGYLGPWHWNIKKDIITLNPIQEEMFKLKELKKLSFNEFIKLIHDSDKDLVKKEFDDHRKGNIPVIEIEYRVLFDDDNYHWIYHRAEIDETDASNKPLHIMGIIMDITEKRKNEEYLSNEKKIHEKNATLDFLTNLLNRRGLHDHTNRYLEGKDSTNNPISLAMFDIDNFKIANDTYGHEYGDQVLLEIANLLIENTRSGDIVSRFGGDEFLIVFTNMELDEAYKVCDRIRHAAQKKYQYSDIKITLSGGVSEYHNEDLKELIKKVDNQLYQAKNNGKNKIVK